MRTLCPLRSTLPRGPCAAARSALPPAPLCAQVCTCVTVDVADPAPLRGLLCPQRRCARSSAPCAALRAGSPLRRCGRCSVLCIVPSAARLRCTRDLPSAPLRVLPAPPALCASVRTSQHPARAASLLLCTRDSALCAAARAARPLCHWHTAQHPAPAARAARPLRRCVRCSAPSLRALPLPCAASRASFPLRCCARCSALCALRRPMRRCMRDSALCFPSRASVRAALHPAPLHALLPSAALRSQFCTVRFSPLRPLLRHPYTAHKTKQTLCSLHHPLRLCHPQCSACCCACCAGAWFCFLRLAALVLAAAPPSFSLVHVLFRAPQMSGVAVPQTCAFSASVAQLFFPYTPLPFSAYFFVIFIH